MKILLKEFDEKWYTWQDATYVEDGFVVNDCLVSETSILAVEDDDCANYLKCPKCGKIFKKGSKEAEEHVSVTFDINNCEKCKYRRENGRTNVRSYIYKDEDTGRYKKRDYVDSNLYCGLSSEYLGTDVCTRHCEHNACANQTLQELSTIFTNNPGIFDTMCTVSKILNIGYKDCYSQFNFMYYRLKGRRSIYAVVNMCNVVDYFLVSIGRHECRARYSFKYNRLYIFDDSKYVEATTFMTKDQEEACCAQIRKYFE